MADDPKAKPGPGQNVPSFDQLAPRRPAAAPPSSALTHDEKTATIDADTLRKALKQSQTGAPIPPPPKPPPVAIDENTKLNFAPMPPGARQPPPPPAGYRPPTAAEARTMPATNPTARAAPLPPIASPRPPVSGMKPAAPPGSRPPDPNMGELTDPAGMPPVRPQAGASTPITGREPVVARVAPAAPAQPQPSTERLAPVTPDMIPPVRASPGRALAPVQAGAPRAADASHQQTQLSQKHQRERITDGAMPLRSTTVTQPHAQSPWASSASSEPPTENHADPGPSELIEQPTKSLRSSSRPNPVLDIEADILSEVKKLGTNPGEVPPTVSTRATPGAGTVEAVEVIAHPASLTRRVGALLVDAALLAAIDTGIALAVFALGKAPPLAAGMGLLDVLATRVHDVPKLMAAIAVMSTGVAAAYTTLFAVALSGRTPGRLVFGLRLVDRRGGPPGTGRALVRAVLALVSFAVFLTGFWLALFDARGQTLHDKLCSTFVVRLGPSRT